VPRKRGRGIDHRHCAAGRRRLDGALRRGRGGHEMTASNQRQIVLVLQGGGALGAFQAGVYQALQAHGLEPDWIIGTSIGAINASLIAGNPAARRLPRLAEFWRRMAHRPPFGVPSWTGVPDVVAYWSTLLRGIPAFFEPNRGAFLGTHVP